MYRYCYLFLLYFGWLFQDFSCNLIVKTAYCLFDGCICSYEIVIVVWKFYYYDCSPQGISQLLWTRDPINQ